MGNLGIGEIILIFAVILLIFGAKKLPDFARSLGESIKIFKKSVGGSDKPEKDNDQKN